MFYSVKLRIAGIIIEMYSKYEAGLKGIVLDPSKEIPDNEPGERYKNFLYTGERKPDIRINVEVVNRLPNVKRIKSMFITRHFQDGSENWRLLKRKGGFIYKSPLEAKKLYADISRVFNRAVVYLLPKKEKGYVWNIADIIYDFLQILLINYFAQRNEGIFVHAFGVRDSDGKGFLFSGKSGCGKSTSAKLWHKHSKAMVLNDDRIIVRKSKNRFFIHSCPWHGDFSDYFASEIESAPLEKLFFIHHSSQNIARRIPERRAFSLLYPALFPTFWNKQCLENIASFSQGLVKSVPCYSFGFVNDKRVIGFVRKIRDIGDKTSPMIKL